MLIDVAQLSGNLCETLLYGIFLSLAVSTAHVLIKGKTSPVLLVATGASLGLSTTRLVIDCIQTFRAFIPLDRQQRLIYLNDVTEPIFAAKHATYFTMVLVGDFIAIYRCFVLWDRNLWVILLPFLCSIGSAVSGYQTIWTVRHLNLKSNSQLNVLAITQREASWGLALFSLSLIANASATGLSVYRLWKHEHQLASFGIHRISIGYSRIIRIVLESGVINAANLLAYTAVLASNSIGIEIMECISTPLIGIILTTAILRASSDNRSNQSLMSTTTRIPIAQSHDVQMHTITSSSAQEQWADPMLARSKLGKAGSLG